MGFSLASNVYMLYGSGIILGISGSLVYGPGLTCVQKWWPEKSGLVSGVYNLCFGLSAALMIPLYRFFLGGSGYRAALWIISGIVLAFGLAASIFADSPKRGGGLGETVKLPGYTVGQATADRSFKMLWLIWGLAGTAGIGLVMHIIPLMEVNGFTAEQGSKLLIFFNVFNGVIRIVVGPMLDKADGRLFMCIPFLLGGTACCMLTLIRSFALAALCLCLIGMTTGIVFTVTPVMLREYFGLRNFWCNIRTDLYVLLFFLSAVRTVFRRFCQRYERFLYHHNHIFWFVLNHCRSAGGSSQTAGGGQNTSGEIGGCYAHYCRNFRGQRSGHGVRDVEGPADAGGL